jgi:DNA-binding CsgD family transcriptional regulator
MPTANVGFEELLVQQRITNLLLAQQLQRTHDLTQAELAVLMGDAGASSVEIALILGTTQNTVQVTLSRARKQKRGQNRGTESKT